MALSGWDRARIACAAWFWIWLGVALYTWNPVWALIGIPPGVLVSQLRDDARYWRNLQAQERRRQERDEHDRK